MIKLLISLFALIVAISAQSIAVQTSQGTFQGQFTTTDTRSFLGIRYAAPPVGSLRFKAPQQYNYTTSITNATSYGAICPQPPLPGFTQSEDCLYLNIWAPSNATNLPVVFFVHGGDFETGTGNNYNGTYLVHNSIAMGSPVIFVSINYRLGALGFLADQSLQTPGQPYGSWGLLDQSAALQWVKSNIGGFGGNPDSITFAGESFGGSSALIFMISSYLNPNGTLFQRAIIESGVFWQDMTINVPYGQQIANQVKSALPCGNSTQCLMNSTVSDILSAQSSLQPAFYYPNVFGPYLFKINWFGPLIDGILLSDTLLTSISKGNFKDLPILLGSNANETALFTCNDASLSTTTVNYYSNTTIPDSIEDLVPMIGTNLTNAIANIYINTSYSSSMSLFNTIVSDSILHCPTRWAASHFSNAFLYTFAQHISNLDPCLGAPHMGELPFLFPTTVVDNLVPGANFTSAESALSLNMVKYWTTFATTGNPNSNMNLPVWSKYNATSDTELLIAVPISSRSGFYTNVCNFWYGEEGLTVPGAGSSSNTGNGPSPSPTPIQQSGNDNAHSSVTKNSVSSIVCIVAIIVVAFAL